MQTRCFRSKEIFMGPETQVNTSGTVKNALCPKKNDLMIAGKRFSYMWLLHRQSCIPQRRISPEPVTYECGIFQKQLFDSCLERALIRSHVTLSVSCSTEGSWNFAIRSQEKSEWLLRDVDCEQTHDRLLPRCTISCTCLIVDGLGRPPAVFESQAISESIYLEELHAASTPLQISLKTVCILKRLSD